MTNRNGPGMFATLLVALAGAAVLWPLAVKLKAFVAALPLAVVLLWILLIPLKLFLLTKLWRWMAPRVRPARA